MLKETRKIGARSRNKIKMGPGPTRLAKVTKEKESLLPQRHFVKD